MPLPPDLSANDATGAERTSVIQPQADGTNKRFLITLQNIILFARKVSPTVRSLAISATNSLTYTLTTGEVKDLGSVQGPAGPKGDKGDAGVPGGIGPAGPAGPVGPTGSAGIAGPTGATGPAGPAGVQGPAGPKGDTGAQGLKGDTGATGLTGPQGPKGDTGATGATGQQGPKGDTGATGPAGTPKRVERYTATTDANGVARFTYSLAFTTLPDVQVIPGWLSGQYVGGGATAETLTGCTVQGMISRATLLLSAGPFQTAGAGVPITIRVIGN